jgi:hypothetical protein
LPTLIPHYWSPILRPAGKGDKAGFGPPQPLLAGSGIIDLPGALELICSQPAPDPEAMRARRREQTTSVELERVTSNK